MTELWVRPVVRHELAIALRFVDPFTGRPITDPLDVRLATAPWWEPHYARSDSTYRFARSVEPIPNLGLVDVLLEVAEPARYALRTPLQVTVPRPPPPVPVPYVHYLVEHPLEPTTAFRPPPGETAVRGVVVDAGAPQAGFEVAIGVGAAPVAATPRVHTDAAGEFVYRLPGATAVVAGANVTTTASLHIAIADAGGNPRAINAPAIPHVVPLGRTTPLTVDLN